MKTRFIRVALLATALLGSATAYAAGTGCCDDLLCCLQQMLGCC